MERGLDITKPRYNEHILPVPKPFVKSRFHCRMKCVDLTRENLYVELTGERILAIVLRTILFFTLFEN